MSEYGTPCPGCRRILHVTIDLEPEPERPPETAESVDAALLLEEAVVKAGNAGIAHRSGIGTRSILIPEDRWQAVVRAREAHRDARHARPPADPENEAAAQLVERLAELWHQDEPDIQAGEKMGACPYQACVDARKLASRLRGDFPEPHISVVAADCGCTIRKGPPWRLEPCEHHRLGRGGSVADTYRAAAALARGAVLDIGCSAEEATGVVRDVRDAIGVDLERQADQAKIGTNSGVWGEFMSAVVNACNELNDMGNDAGHRLREASELYRAGS